MSRPRRTQRLTTKRFTVYCEGETESRYVDGLKAWLSRSRPDDKVAVERVDVHRAGTRSLRRGSGLSRTPTVSRDLFFSTTTGASPTRRSELRS